MMKGYPRKGVPSIAIAISRAPWTFVIFPRERTRDIFQFVNYEKQAASMVIIKGQSTRAATTSFVIALAFLLGAVLAILDVYNEVSGKRPWPADAALSYEAHRVLTFIFAPLTSLILLLSSIAATIAGRAFAKGIPTILITGTGLQFPFVPGLRAGRSVGWDDVHALSVVTTQNCPKGFEQIISLGNRFFGKPLFIKVDLRRSYKIACKYSRFLGSFYWIDRLALGKNVPQTCFIETIHAGNLPHEHVIEALFALSQDPDLRNRYLTSEASYVICRSASGESLFELDGL